MTSLGPVEISSLTGFAPVNYNRLRIREPFLPRFLATTMPITILALTIQNGRSETGGGLKIANSATSERIQLSDVVVKDSLAENLGGVHVVSASPKFDNVVVQNCSG